ncbi:MAG: glycosyltransferase [Eubacterium sp.]|nr:glycosyltransferase [Eubacterium sp.]
MKYLFIITSGSILDLYVNMKKMGEDIEVFPGGEFHPHKDNADEHALLEDFLKGKSYDCIISYMFIPSISDFCMDKGMLYVSWTYDSPLQDVYTESIENPCNIIFLFDKAESEYVKSLGINNVYYMPLAGDLSRVGAINITEEDEKTFSHQISFIGSTYMENSYNQCVPFYPEDIKNEFKLYLMQNTCRWDRTKPWPSISEAATKFYEDTIKIDMPSLKYFPKSTFLGILVLSRKLAELDRLTVLNALAERHPVTIYTKDNSPYLENLEVHPGVDYSTDMNKVFYLSKINLNITLPSIRTGIPQRLFDIMQCGGFLLTNWQEEIDELFNPGKDIEVFHSLEELTDKAGYYLSHEDARARIAINAYMTIRDHHTYPRRLRQMLDIINKYK